ncbi:hypothetical protein [Actinomadura nitritigenes]|uniref:hypothetical protein n=1 Tax=Actinomadura nitritigenes TaxID=134602 RepID=UPI003D8ED5F8
MTAWQLEITRKVNTGYANTQAPDEVLHFDTRDELLRELNAQGVPGRAIREGGHQFHGYRLIWREVPTTTTSKEDNAMTEQTATEYVVTKSGQRKHPLRPDGTVPCEAAATLPATGKKADFKVCAKCEAVLADEATAQAAEERNVELRIGKRLLDFVAGRLDPEANAELLGDIAAATVKRAGNGFNAYLKTTPTSAAQLARAILALHADMVAKKVRTTQTGFRAPWLTGLAASVAAAADAARDAA